MQKSGMAARWGGRIKNYLAGVGALAVVGGSLLQVAAFRAKNGKIKVPDGCVLHLDMSVPIVEQPPTPWVVLTSPRPPLCLRSVVRALESAAQDKRVKGIVCTFGNNPAPSLAVVQELGAAVLDFREAQKKEQESGRRFSWVTTDTFGEGGGGFTQYYLASHFDRIFMQPSGMIWMLGVHHPTFFYKKLLNKVGIEPQFFKFFEFKNAPNQYTEDKYTEPHRQQSQLLADSIFQQFIGTISRLRAKSETQLKECVDAAPLSAQVALAAGLIDSILYRDQVLSMAFDGEGDKTNMMSMSSYIKATEPKESAATTAKKPKIGLVYATGSATLYPKP